MVQTLENVFDRIKSEIQFVERLDLKLHTSPMHNQYALIQQDQHKHFGVLSSSNQLQGVMMHKRWSQLGINTEDLV